MSNEYNCKNISQILTNAAKKWASDRISIAFVVAHFSRDECRPFIAVIATEVRQIKVLTV